MLFKECKICGIELKHISEYSVGFCPMCEETAEKEIVEEEAQIDESKTTFEHAENKDQFDEIFRNEQFDPDDLKLYSNIYNTFAGAMWQFSNPDFIPNCIDKTLAFRKIREALFHLERAILQKEKYFGKT